MFIYKTANTHVRDGKGPIMSVMETATPEFPKNKIINKHFFMLLPTSLAFPLYPHQSPPHHYYTFPGHTHTHTHCTQTHLLTFVN